MISLKYKNEVMDYLSLKIHRNSHVDYSIFLDTREEHSSIFPLYQNYDEELLTNLVQIQNIDSIKLLLGDYLNDLYYLYQYVKDFNGVDGLLDTLTPEDKEELGITAAGALAILFERCFSSLTSKISNYNIDFEARLTLFNNKYLANPEDRAPINAHVVEEVVNDKTKFTHRQIYYLLKKIGVFDSSFYMSLKTESQKQLLIQKLLNCNLDNAKKYKNGTMRGTRENILVVDKFIEKITSDKKR